MRKREEKEKDKIKIINLIYKYIHYYVILYEIIL
jgi:hypothetical protein